jgi:hypothetical protein
MKKRTVYPVEGRWLNGVPAVEHECTDPLCVESGAFTDKPPPRAAKQASTETPQDAGSSDSSEES